MNTPNIEQKAIEIIEAMQAAASDAGSFALEQAGPLTSEIVLRGRVMTAAGVVGFLLLAVMLFVVARLTYTKAAGMPPEYVRDEHGRKIPSHDYDGSKFGLQVASGTSGGLGFICAIAVVPKFVYEAATPWFAPRLYILEYARDLIGGL